jgi:hypothetical protein
MSSILGDGNELCLVVLRFLINVWFMNSFGGPVLDSSLVTAVTALVTADDVQTLSLSFSALANLASYCPALLLSNTALTSRALGVLGLFSLPGVLEPVLRFVLAECRLQPLEFVAFVPILLQVLDHRVEAIKGLSAEILCQIAPLDEGFAAIESHGGLEELMRTVRYSDVSRLMPIYSSLLEFARRGIVEPFHNDDFFGSLNTAINQYASRPATPMWQLLMRMMPLCWAALLEFGIIEVMLDCTDRVEFENKVGITGCIIAFFESADKEAATGVALDTDALAFRMLIGMVVAMADAEDLRRLLETIWKFIDVGEPFTEIALEEDLLGAMSDMNVEGAPELEQVIADLMGCLRPEDDN